MKPQRINSLNAGLLILAAIIFDLLSIIPLINVITAFVAWLIFGVWFYLLGVGFMNPKRFATIAVSLIIGVIPVLSVLPELTVAIIAIIIMVKSEDKFGLKIPLSGKK
jgi:hypothetical protein